MRRALSSCLLLLLAAPAGADWLVTRAGGRIETQGPWQVKGKLIVFKAANGDLASLRLADVDLAASETATAEAKQAKEKAAAPEATKPPERRKSVRSLTDADFSRKPGGPDDAGGTAEGKDKDAKAKPDEKQGAVEVSSWSKADRAEGDGIDIFGTLQNNGKDMATDIVLRVTLSNEEKETVGSGDGVLAATTIPPGGSTSFRVPFSGVFTFVQAHFDVTNKTVTFTPVTPGTPAPAPPAATDAAAKKKAAPPPPPPSGA
jgi:hypothetical protein